MPVSLPLALPLVLPYSNAACFALGPLAVFASDSDGGNMHSKCIFISIYHLSCIMFRSTVKPTFKDHLHSKTKVLEKKFSLTLSFTAMLLGAVWRSQT